MNIATDTVTTSYRLVIDTDNGLTSSPWPFVSVDAAMTAAPALNRSRFARGRHCYSHVAQFAGDTLVALLPLGDA